jgi:catechol 2,3-dioxygenase-like lactoylglutathione lyase family enzyme
MTNYVSATQQLVTEIVVRDIPASRDFYSALGFRVVRDEGNFVELTWEDHCFFLTAVPLGDLPEGAAIPPPPPLPWANVRVMVPDVDKYWKRANQLGARVVNPIGDRYYGLRDFIIADPDGFGVRFASLLQRQ